MLLESMRGSGAKVAPDPLVTTTSNGGGEPEPPIDFGDHKAFVDQERRRRETIYLGRQKSIFVSHCWRSVDEQLHRRKRQIVSYLSAPTSAAGGGCGLPYWGDWLDLQASGPVPWRREIEEGIESCAKVVCFLDGQYLQSFNCLQEVAYAIQYSKEVVPILLDQAGFEMLVKPQGHQLAWDGAPDGQGPAPLKSYEGQELVPGKPFTREELTRLFRYLADINFCFCRELDFAGRGDDMVIRAVADFVEKDLPYLKQHAQLLTHAREWDVGGRPASGLFSDDALKEFESWMRHAERAGMQPPPHAMHKALLHASQARARSRVRLLRGLATGAVLAIVAGIIAAAILAVQAVKSKNVATAATKVAQSLQAAAQAAQETTLVENAKTQIRLLQVYSQSLSANGASQLSAQLAAEASRRSATYLNSSVSTYYESSAAASLAIASAARYAYVPAASASSYSNGSSTVPLQASAMALLGDGSGQLLLGLANGLLLVTGGVPTASGALNVLAQWGLGTQPVTVIAAAPSGRWVAAFDGSAPRLFAYNSSGGGAGAEQPLAGAAGSGDTVSLAFSSDSALLYAAGCGRDGTVSAWAVATGARVAWDASSTWGPVAAVTADPTGAVAAVTWLSLVASPPAQGPNAGRRLQQQPPGGGSGGGGGPGPANGTAPSNGTAPPSGSGSNSTANGTVASGGGTNTTNSSSTAITLATAFAGAAAGFSTTNTSCNLLWWSAAAAAARGAPSARYTVTCPATPACSSAATGRVAVALSRDGLYLALMAQQRSTAATSNQLLAQAMRVTDMLAVNSPPPPSPPPPSRAPGAAPSPPSAGSSDASALLVSEGSRPSSQYYSAIQWGPARTGGGAPLLAAATESEAYTWDPSAGLYPADGGVVAMTAPNAQKVVALAWMADNSSLIAASSSGGLTWFNVQPSPCAFSLIDTTGLTSYSSTVSSLRFVDTTGEQLVAVTLMQNNVSSYYSVRGWQSLTAAAAALQAGAATVAPTVTLTGATTVAPVPHEPVSAGVAMSADARVVAVLNGNVVNVRVVSGSATGVAALAATAASQQLTLNASVPHLTLDVAPAGDLVAVSEGPGVGLYHIALGVRVSGGTVPGASGNVSTLAFSPSGTLLATFSTAGEMTLWNVSSAAAATGAGGLTFVASVGSVEGVTTVSGYRPQAPLTWSPSSRWLLVAAAGSSGTQVALFDMSVVVPAANLTAGGASWAQKMPSSDPINAAAFSADSARAAVCAQAGNVYEGAASAACSSYSTWSFGPDSTTWDAQNYCNGLARSARWVVSAAVHDTLLRVQPATPDAQYACLLARAGTVSSIVIDGALGQSNSTELCSA